MVEYTVKRFLDEASHDPEAFESLVEQFQGLEAMASCCHPLSVFQVTFGAKDVILLAKALAALKDTKERYDVRLGQSQN